MREYRRGGGNAPARDAKALPRLQVRRGPAESFDRGIVRPPAAADTVRRFA